MLVMILKYTVEILLLQEQHSRIININEDHSNNSGFTLFYLFYTSQNGALAWNRNLTNWQISVAVRGNRMVIPKEEYHEKSRFRCS